MKSGAFIMMLILYSLMAIGQDPDQATKEDIDRNLQWIWSNGDAPPAKLSVWTRSVLIGPNGDVTAIRGNTGAITCGNIAVLYALAGKREAALSWLTAAQAHNPPVVQLFETYPIYTVDLAKLRYKEQAIKAGGLGKPASDLKQLGGILGGVFNLTKSDPKPPKE